MRETETVSRIFLPPRHFAVGAIAGGLFFVAMTILSVRTTLLNSDKSFPTTVLPAIFEGCFGGIMTLLSTYSLLSYCRTRLLTTPLEVRSITAFRDRSVVLAQVTRARWQFGGIILYTPLQRVAISFASYRERWDVSSYFRSAIPESIQENYPQFERVMNRARRVSPPQPVSVAATQWLSIASLVIAAGAWIFWNFRWIRAVVILPVFLVPAMAFVTALDFFRRRSRVNAIAVAISWTALTFALPTVWAVLRPIYLYHCRLR